MATVLDSITAALKEIGVLAVGETPSSEDSADALAALNRLVDQWAAERLQLYTTTRTTWTITSGTQDYAVASGQVVNVARPVLVDHVHFIDTAPAPDIEYPLTSLSEDGWSSIAQKALTSPFPEAYYYNPTLASGLISLWPVPTSTTLQGVLYAPAAIAQFAALTTTVSLPPGYARMIVKNLALELLSSYGRKPDPALVEQAANSKAIVRRANRRPADLSFETGLGGGGNWDIHQGP